VFPPQRATDCRGRYLLAIDRVQDVATLDLTRVVGRTSFVYTLYAHSASADLHEDDTHATHLRRRTPGLLLGG
jgi:hypothetical protein